MYTAYRMCSHAHLLQNVFSCTPYTECVLMHTPCRMCPHVHLIQNVWSVVRQISYRMCSQTRRKPSWRPSAEGCASTHTHAHTHTHTHRERDSRLCPRVLTYVCSCIHMRTYICMLVCSRIIVGMHELHVKQYKVEGIERERERERALLGTIGSFSPRP